MKVFAAAIFLGATLFAAEPLRQRPQSTTTDHFDFAPGGTVRLLDTRGSVAVEGWDQPRVEIVVTRSMGDLETKEERDRDVPRLGRVQVKIEHTATEASVTTLWPKRGFFARLKPFDIDLDYVVRVPRDSHVVVHQGAGAVLIADVSGGIEATARRGDIVAMLPNPGPYSIDAKTRLGTVYSDFGDARRRLLIGERFAASKPAPSRRIYLRTGVGGIQVQEINPGGY